VIVQNRGTGLKWDRAKKKTVEQKCRQFRWSREQEKRTSVGYTNTSGFSDQITDFVRVIKS